MIWHSYPAPANIRVLIRYTEYTLSSTIPHYKYEIYTEEYSTVTSKFGYEWRYLYE